MRNTCRLNRLRSIKEGQLRFNITSKKGQGKGKRGVHTETAAGSGCAAASLRVSLNCMERAAEQQETGMSSNCACQSFTRPKNTRHLLFRKKPEIKCNRS